MEPTYRPGLFGIGMFWSHWRGDLLPTRFRDKPRAYDQAQMDLIVEAGGTNIPIGMGWISCEPERGAYDWRELDEHVEDALARDLDIVAYVGHTPDWAVPEPNDGSGKLPGWRTPPDERYAQEFQEYCFRLASRYRGAVRMFSFWNEPNGCSWINNGCSNMGGYPLYTHWLKRAYAALRTGNPEIEVSAGSLDYNEGVPAGWRYIQGIYDEGGGAFFDAMDIHPYAAQGIHWQAILDTRQVMLDNGDGDKPIWISEYGWQHPDNERSCDDLRRFLSVLRREEYSFVTHARYLVVTDLNEGLYGLCDVDLNKRSIYEAYKHMDKHMLPHDPEDPLPIEVLPYEFRDRRAGGTVDLHAARVEQPYIEAEKTMVEYGEELHMIFRWPELSAKLIDVRWVVDDEQIENSSAHLFFARRPEQETQFTVCAEAVLEDRTFAASIQIIVRPFVSNNFTVLIDEAPNAIDRRDEPVLLSTRVLNRSSHDLTYQWYINGNPLEGEISDTLEVSGEKMGPGIFTFSVNCINAGMTSTAEHQLQIL